MNIERGTDDEHLRTSPGGANPNPELLSEYDTSPEVLHTPEPEQGDNQKQLDQVSELGASKGEMLGMKRKTFMIVLGIFVILIIAVAAGVGWGVGVAAARSRNNKNGASESAASNPQDSYVPTSSFSLPTPSSDPPEITTTVSTGPATPTPTQNTPLAAFSWNTSYIQIFYKLPDGTIGSRDSYGSKWLGRWGGIIKPKAGSPLAAVGWLEGDVRQVRVYTVSEKNTLRESRSNSATPSVWITRGVPDTEDPVALAAGSQLTCTWPKDMGQGVRVYYQDPEGHIQEVSWDGTNWKKGPQPGI